MGYAYPTKIEPAGTFLLQLLANTPEGTVDYSAFYDGTDETADRLAVSICDDVDDLEDFVDHGSIYIDLPVDQPEAAGILERIWLGTKLADSEPNYRIVLTGVGRAFFKSGKTFQYHAAE